MHQAEPDGGEPGHGLTRAQCLRLLRTLRVGRVVVTENSLPSTLPVIFGVHANTVLFRVAPGSRLGEATHLVVAFQADCVDPTDNSGWTVTATGYAEPVRDERRLRHADRLGLRSWARDGDGPVVGVTPVVLRGHRLPGRPAMGPPATALAGSAPG